ncbi:MAG: GatB/YqeY domain-containing protein [Candidatus Saccharimonadales bacterium]
MSLKQQLDQDLKTAMLAGEKQTVTVLRGLKGAVLNVEIQNGSREQGLSDEEVLTVLAKESKKRQESADMYRQGNSPERVEAELAEKEIIDKYLPQQMSEQDLETIIKRVILERGALNMQAMGQVVGAVKQEVGGQADGGRIAQKVKELLT